MHLRAPAPHLARVHDTVASPIGVLRVVAISFVHPFDPTRPKQHGGKALPPGWLRRIDFVHTTTGRPHTTFLPEPDYPPTFCQAMYGHPAIGYTICGPWTTYEEAANQARAEAMLTKRPVQFVLDGIVVSRFLPSGEEQSCD